MVAIGISAPVVVGAWKQQLVLHTYGVLTFTQLPSNLQLVAIATPHGSGSDDTRFPASWRWFSSATVSCNTTAVQLMLFAAGEAVEV